jgi:hypothetical protein
MVVFARIMALLQRRRHFPIDSTAQPAGQEVVDPNRKGSSRRPTFGSARGLVTVPEEFEETLQDFEDYM